MHSTRQTHSQRRKCVGGPPATPIRLPLSSGSWRVDRKGDIVLRGNGTIGADREVSARKLAAGLWRLWLVAQNAGAGRKGRTFKCGSLDAPRFELGVENANLSSHCLATKRPVSVRNHGFKKCSSKSGIILKCTMEEATKWDPRCSRVSNEVHCFYSRVKLLEDKVTSVSVASAVQAELVQAQLQIHELQAECRSSKKKVEHLLRKFEEERRSWEIQEQHKFSAVVNGLKSEIRRGRKKHRKMEIFNSKLVNELICVKSFAKKLRDDYEKEKKARELMEEVCNELANKLAENKVEFEALRMDSIKTEEEMEEERKMLQLAEVWREERVHMKLIDAKLALEDKYNQMNNLVTELETFLSSRSATMDVMELRKAEVIRNAAKMVRVRDMKELSYVPSKSSDIYSVLEEVRQIEANRRSNEICYDHNTDDDVSKTHHASSVENGGDNQKLFWLSNGLEDDPMASVTATLREAEDQDSIHSLEGNDLSIGRFRQTQNGWQSRKQCDENYMSQESSNRQISEVCSTSAEQSMQEKTASQLRRPGTSNGRYCKIASDDSNGRLSNSTISSAVTSSPNRTM